MKAKLTIDGKEFETEVTSFDFGTSTNEYPYCGLTIKSNCEEFKEIFLKRMKFQENNRFTLEE
jgi:hypothetical protein